MCLSRCWDKIEAFLGLHARELYTHLYRTKSLPKEFSIVWSAWPRISEKLEMAKKKKKKKYCKEKWLDKTILLIEKG